MTFELKFADGFEAPILVGEGAFGKVYRIKNTRENRYEAVKLLSQKDIWEREALALRVADHPLFPTLYEAGELDDGYYLRMEYIWGTNLEEAIVRREGFEQPQAMRIAITIADGLAFLQQNDGRFLYRDLKASNLIVEQNGDIRLVDLGCVATQADSDRSIAGTPGSSAPEQFETDKQSGTFSDVYAFGMLFWFLLTGRRASSCSKTFPFLRKEDPSLSAALELLICDCVRKTGEERIPDMACVLDRLVAIASCTPFRYFILERKCARALKKRAMESAYVFEQDVCE